ncbi:DUF4229 domain-containing protein [Frankia sp. AiPs1]|uniref:DUF4229 domain-containing protein n=1 Tax=Frankia sp. AiPa1 TaxID=573492 RepID=UPI00202ADA31|nr:DUF4229 domain-containing protein [Frankia sp. AiPa1]MCL9757885.1 DUF4229 domain-containing protein [Frankia sp. AiPa1]
MATGGSAAKGRGGKTDRPKPPAKGSPPADPNLRAQLPYFVARLAVLVVVTVVLAVTGVNVVLAVLIGFVVAGLLTWPLGRMQRRAAQRSSQRGGTGGPRERGDAGSADGAGSR